MKGFNVSHACLKCESKSLKFFKRYFILFILLSSAVSALALDNVPLIEKNHQPHFYASLSGGYGSFTNVLYNEGTTGVFRFALGARFDVKDAFLLGAELGIQNGNRMSIYTDNAVLVLGDAPIFLTIRPPVDALLTATAHLGCTPAFILAKGGVAYLQGVTDSATINNKYQVRPEAQLGLGVDVTSSISLLLYYQRIFGNKPVLTNLDSIAGTATLDRLPTFQAVFLGVQMSF